MPSSSLRGADQVGYSWPFELEVCSLCCFEAFAPFLYESVSPWAFRCQTHQGRASGSVGDAVSEAPECETENPGFTEKDRPALAKVPKLGASSSPSSTPVRKPGLALSPPAEVPKVLSSQPRSGSVAKAKSPSGMAVEQPLAIMPITVWNPPAKSVRPLSLKAEELKRKDSETGGDGDSLFLDIELAAGAVSSILKDFDLKRSSALPVDEALALSLQGVASVSSHILSYLISF